MKINKIHIISFGGLKNFTLDFKDGFNCIYGENEQGKTTIMSFIKMMFYGNSYTGAVLQNNLRKKYTPWDSSQMAGIIEFENKGISYRLEREFKKSNSTDKVTLTDLSLGEKQTVESDIGSRLFGLSQGAFERSIFIGQLGFPSGDSNAEGELNARLSNMVSTGDEKISLEEVSSRLQKARFSIISKSGRTGEYYKNLQITNDLQQRFDRSIESEKMYSEGKAKLSEFVKETDSLSKKAELIKEKLSKEEDIKNAEKLEELLKTKESLEALKQACLLNDGTAADENYLRGLKFSLSMLENASQRVKEKEKETEIIKNNLETLINGPKLGENTSPEEINDRLLKLQNESDLLNSQILSANEKLQELKLQSLKNNKKSFNPLFLSLAVFLFILSVFGVALSIIVPSVITMAVGVICLILTFAIRPSSKISYNIISKIQALEAEVGAKNERLKTIQSEINENRATLEAIKLASNSNSQVIEAQNSKLNLCLTELNYLKAEESSLKGEFDSLILKFSNPQNKTPQEIMNFLEESSVKQKEMKQHINLLLKYLNNISYEDAKLKLREIKNQNGDFTENFEEIKNEYDRLLTEITKRRSTEGAVKAELKSLIANAENPEILEKELSEKAQLLRSQKNFCDCCDIALETLLESFSELRRSYGSKLEKISAHILSQITDGKYKNMTVSKSFGVNVEENSNPISREAEYLSNGTFDQAYLSLRLALSRLINQELPLFLDDSLTQYDDKRAEKTLKFLGDYAKDSQMIMFTCHKSFSEISKNLSLNVTELS